MQRGRHVRQVKIRQDIRHQDRGRALAVRRMLDQFDVLIGARDRGRVVTARVRQIVQRMNPAQRVQRGNDILGDLALIIALAPVNRDFAQDLGLTGRAKYLTDIGGVIVEQVMTARVAL